MNRIVLSRLRNPAINLAVESALFRSLGPSDRLLFVYINSPCVVVGRNQNPWKEANIVAAHKLGVPVIRRRSGGGCVVHDEGNVNFCVQLPRQEFSRDRFLHALLGSLSPAAQKTLAVNNRNDIVTVPENRKVSGSSYKIEREKSYHHATMLLQSNLDNLRELLHRDTAVCGDIVKANGTDSVPSPVANNPAISTDEFVAACTMGFKHLYPTAHEIEYVDEHTITDEIKEDANQLSSWEWTYGQTPTFVHRVRGYDFEVHKGVIEHAPPVYKSLVGRKYRDLTELNDSMRIAIEPWAVLP